MTKFTFIGLEELKAALKSLPTDLRDEANEEIRDIAMTAGDAVRAAYSRHRVTGNLVKGVKVRKVSTGQYGVAYKVESTAPHATIFERGTEARHYITENGVKHLTGRMPAFNIFGPIMGRHRRFLFDRLGTLLTKHGLLVRGDVAA